jgi:hypothetical protein
MRARLLLLLVTVAGAAHADRGELSLELGLGGSLANVHAPYADGSPAKVGTTSAFSLGVTYGKTNFLELDAKAFWELPATFVHNGVTVQGFPGDLQESSQRFGALAGVRFVTAYSWRVFIGVDAGYSIRMFSDLNHFDVSEPAPRSDRLQLANTTQGAIVVAPSAGVAYAGDHYVIGLAPRFEALLGSPTTWSFVVPLTLSYGWYL